MKVIAYTIISADRDRLEGEVQANIKLGWEPLGSPFVTQTIIGHPAGGYIPPSQMLNQAMVKKAKCG